MKTHTILTPHGASLSATCDFVGYRVTSRWRAAHHKSLCCETRRAGVDEQLSDILKGTSTMMCRKVCGSILAWIQQVSGTLPKRIQSWSHELRSSDFESRVILYVKGPFHTCRASQQSRCSPYGRICFGSPLRSSVPLICHFSVYEFLGIHWLWKAIQPFPNYRCKSTKEIIQLLLTDNIFSVLTEPYKLMAEISWASSSWISERKTYVTQQIISVATISDCHLVFHQ